MKMAEYIRDMQVRDHFHLLEKGQLHFQMVQDMKANGNRDKCMVMVLFIGKMEVAI